MHTLKAEVGGDQRIGSRPVPKHGAIVPNPDNQGGNPER
jgi:hypothetical protein